MKLRAAAACCSCLPLATTRSRQPARRRASRAPAMSATIAAWCWSSIQAPRRRSSSPAGADPLWFTQVRDAIAFTRLPEEPRDITAIWVNDMGRTTNWEAPEAGAWTDAHSAWFVIASSQAGGMGAAEAVPFGTEPPATGIRGGAWRPRGAPGRDPGRLRPGLDAAAGRCAAARPAGRRVMNARLGRRRLLITATAGGLALLAGDARAIRAATWRWQGAALGADSTILLAHPDQAAARQAIGACRTEITRLERIFSLYRADSALSQLNRQGQLESPPLELVELLAFSARVSAATGGAFDVTVQPLWDLYAGHFANPAANPAGPDDAALAATLARVDWRAIEIDLGPDWISSTWHGGDAERRGAGLHHRSRRRSAARPRVRERARRAGRDPSARSKRANSDPWRAGIANPNDPSAVLLELPLLDVALATSGGYGTWFDPAHHHHHIFDPVTGRSANRQAAVSVTASRAMVADVLSTVLMIIPADAGKRLLVTFGPATAYLFALDGARTTIRAVPKTPSGTIPTLRSHGIDAIGACLLGDTAQR